MKNVDDKQKRKLLKSVFETAENHNKETLLKVCNTLQLSPEEQEKVVEILSSNTQFISQWIDKNIGK